VNQRLTVTSSKRRSWIAILNVAAGIVVYFIYPYFLSDRVLMWETTSIKSGRASTHRATEAAKRFFDKHDLRGKTRAEVIATAGDPKTSNKSIYNFPFYPVEPGVMVYRFDTGYGGWQFNIHFDSGDRAIEVSQKGIE
jgi:hypothetical protein